MTDQSPTIVTDDDEESYVESVSRFIAAAEWLDETHRPALKVLRSLAKVLDEARVPQAAIVSQFTLTYRDLAGKKPGAAGGAGEDPSMPPPMDFGDWK